MPTVARRREACKFVGFGQNRPKPVRFEKSFGVSEADEAAVWRKGCERASVSLTPKGLTAKQ